MRFLIPTFVLLALVAGVGGIKLKQLSALSHAAELAEKAGPPPEVVGTAVAEADQWEARLAAVGSVVAARGVSISNEVAGVVTAIHFESGQRVRAGQVLLELDSGVERAQLASAEARRSLAEVGAHRSRKLAETNAVSRAQLDGDEAQLKSSSADYSALAAQIERKTIRAPFAGRLGLRSVNLGQYLNPGTSLTVLESLGDVYVDFTLPQEYLGQVKVGTPVRVRVGNDAAGQELAGAIAAVDPTVEATTRNLKLRATIPNRDDRLRPGMFVSVTVVRGEKLEVVRLPVTAIVHAPYGDSVYVVEDKRRGGQVVRHPDGSPVKLARQQMVRTGQIRGDFVAVVEGVKPGQEVVTEGAFKLRNGSTVAIDNRIKPPAPSLQPHLENE